MYMFDMNRRYNRPIPVSHTNGQSIKNMIGVHMNRLVSKGLKFI